MTAARWGRGIKQSLVLVQKELCAQNQPEPAHTGWSSQRVAIIFTGIILNVYVHTLLPIWCLNSANISAIQK